MNPGYYKHILLFPQVCYNCSLQGHTKVLINAKCRWYKKNLNQCKILPFWSVFSLKFDLGVCKGVQFRFVGLQLPKGLEVFIKTNCWATWQCSGFLFSALSLYLRLFVSLSLCLSVGLFVCLLAHPHAHLPFSLKRLYTII